MMVMTFIYILRYFYGHPMEQGRPLYFHPAVSSIFLLSFFPLLISAVADWNLDVYHTSTHGVADCGPSVNLECRSEMWCARLAGNAGPKKLPKNRLLGTIAQLCRAISSQGRHVSTIAKEIVKQQYLPTCPHNMVNFGPLAAEIGQRVWGTPANFNGFRALASLHRRRSTEVNQSLHDVWPSLGLVHYIYIFGGYIP